MIGTYVRLLPAAQAFEPRTRFVVETVRELRTLALRMLDRLELGEERL